MSSSQKTKTVIIDNKDDMNRYSQAVWLLLLKGYKQVKGGLHFKSIEELIATTSVWKLSLSDNTILAVTIFKAKKGLKLVAMSVNQIFKHDAKQALMDLINTSLNHCWMELSERAETFVMRHCNGKHYIINNQLAPKLLNKSIELSHDGYHYSRNILNIKKEKIIIGSPSFSL